ncbi:alpha-L-iduronidase [Phlebotomus argentipes]|uniref:alpha-L-iduronidase n=1 Tax=Phlebotomus argentipes TaxID=94469 RepID=UPI002892A666|nr:alpha-L-iduronidase [Phlebotomus argentipes]
MAVKRLSSLALLAVFWSISSQEVIRIELSDSDKLRELSRFWTSTGFCPPAPINESSSFLLSSSVRQNLELIASIPNSGITHVRTHWILQLIEARISKNSPDFSFREMNKFINILRRNHLNPHIEFMGDPGKILTGKCSSEKKILWKKLTFQLTMNFVQRFGLAFSNNFRFETWNEPDLASYNTLNFTRSGFIDYVVAIREGLTAVQIIFPGFQFKLRGPAGVFHKRELHQLCYGILEYCSSNPCPVDILTFHRKGLGEAKQILSGGLNLLSNLTKEFPWISKLGVSNDEADPTTGWSHPQAMNSDVRYAAKLAMTVLLHLNAKQRGWLKNLESISHDNAFLSYHPHEFNQRTLLAHFRMNASRPVYSEFVKKPVLGALTLLSNLGSLSGSVKASQNVTFLVTRSNKDTEMLYACIIFVSTRKLPPEQYQIRVKLPSGQNLVAFAEILDNERTNPAKVWQEYSSPAFPSQKIFTRMRRVHTPAVLIPPQPVTGVEFTADLRLAAPFVVSLRFCENSTSNLPQRIKNLRLNRLSSSRVTIVWNEDFRASRCTRNYQIFFRAVGKSRWREISRGWHIPDLSFDFWSAQGIAGAYRVRSVDVMGRMGRFSKTRFVKSACLLDE